MDSSNYITTEAPELFGIGAQSIVDQAKQLGLTWTMHPATGKTSDTVIFDGDTVAVQVINLSSVALTSGVRVMGLVTPTANYVLSGLVSLGHTVNWNSTGNVGSTASTSYVPFAGTPTVILNKGSSATALRVDVAVCVFSLGLLGTADVAVNVAGVNRRVAMMPFSALANYTAVAGSVLVDDVPAGSYTIVLQWAKQGGGSINQDASGYTTFTVQEVW